MLRIDRSSGANRNYSEMAACSLPSSDAVFAVLQMPDPDKASGTSSEQPPPGPGRSPKQGEAKIVSHLGMAHGFLSTGLGTAVLLIGLHSPIPWPLAAAAGFLSRRWCINQMHDRAYSDPVLQSPALASKGSDMEYVRKVFLSTFISVGAFLVGTVDLRSYGAYVLLVSLAAGSFYAVSSEFALRACKKG